MNQANIIWNFLSGKKTVIGAALFFVGQLALQLGLVDYNTLQNLNVAAEVITALGLTHKAWKLEAPAP